MADQPPAGRTERSSLIISNVKLPHSDLELATKLWRVECRNGRVHEIRLLDCQETVIEDSNNLDAKGSIMLPS